MADLLKLAERCEAATGPDRELDAEIGAIHAAEFLGFAVGRQPGCQAYTASIDAAMTLVGDDSGMSFAKSVNNSGGWSVALYDENVMARGATRALALCAAALRARAATSSQDTDQ